jgi:hypothetical protein
MTASLVASYAGLCVAQGATVAAPATGRFPKLGRLRSRWWALIPLAAIVGTVIGVRGAAGTAAALTYLALFTTPPLAAVALGYAARGARPALALCVIPAFAAAWLAHGSLVGEVASVLLVAAGCVTLATGLAAVVPARWLTAGLLLMAAADTVMVVAQLLQAPNDMLNAAALPGGLPQFQRAELGPAFMGYGDLFVAALLGTLLADRHAVQLRGALSKTALALGFGALLFVIHTLPATLPVAGALGVAKLRDRQPATGPRSPACARP